MVKKNIKITEITRRDIIDILMLNNLYSSTMDEIEFLKRLYNLNELPSSDPRFKDAEGDIYQHTINNDDWDRYWIFSDSRFELRTSDEKFLKFICEIFHPAVINKSKDWKRHFEEINNLLKEDGYMLYEKSKISGRAIYNWKEIDSICKSKNSINLTLHPIGKGSYASVFSYTDDFYNKKFALKRVNSNITDKDLERFKKEFEVMKSLDSPYIVEVYHYNSQKNEYIMEHMDTTLHEFISKQNTTLTYQERFMIINQILRCFEYLESKNILHRDISYKNILLKKYEHLIVVKISDFGLVKLQDSTLTNPDTDFKGSLNDPNLKRIGLQKYGKVHETYALTQIIVFILTGKTNHLKIEEKDILNFLDKGTHLDESQRYQNIGEIITAINNLKLQLNE